ncbi:MAG: class I SAM-dependent methyltransferase [Oscillospiraceae bacterium]|jgi:ubiquinone/menaquinone biosynthesis C-methylase UbiE|nr:class I SAM-dependent methyltransferase [Oscillospiraceae bacterium]
MSYKALAHCYDSFTGNMNYAKRADYVTALLLSNGVRSGDTLLDLACGTGGFTYPLQHHGFDMIGVDASEEMLAYAQAKAHAAEDAKAPMFLHQRLEALDLYGTARGAVCLTDSVNHLAEKDLATFLKRLYNFLEPNAPFVFDVNTEYKHESILANHTFVYEDESTYCVWQNAWDRKNAVTHIHMDVFSVNPAGFWLRESEDFAEYVHSERTLKHLLKKANFELKYVYGELTTDKPPKHAERVYCVAVRQP